MIATRYSRLLVATWLSITSVSRVAAQSVAPTNLTSYQDIYAPFVLDTQLQGMKTSPNVNPLTKTAGLGVMQSQLGVSHHGATKIQGFC